MSEDDDRNDDIGCKQRKVPRLIWDDIEFEKVSRLPNDIDGLVKYHIKNENLSYNATHDGRNWKHDSRTTWSGYKTVWYRDCRGGLRVRTYFVDSLSNSENLTQRNKNNTIRMDFVSIVMLRDTTKSHARKYIAFTDVPNEVFVFHVGNPLANQNKLKLSHRFTLQTPLR